ncbi:fat storage-inducing transmembrane protein 1 [Carettochelys insculpta]|uniref:fat storage-inducing transmembrane protein 1 n=1 Tax=Carettochelys insculpta TaxID=44489 RepID=UPI003EBDC6B7
MAAGGTSRLPRALLAAGAAQGLGLARGLVVTASEGGAWLLGAPGLRRAYHAWLAGVVLLGPLLRPFADPHSVLASPHNYFSRTFVASAWGWTCVLAGGFGLLVSYGATGRALAPLRPLARLVVGTALQRAAAAIFWLAEELTGQCYAPPPAGPPPLSLPPPAGPLPLLPPPPLGRADCLAAGLRWAGLLPSRPAFLLTFCCLLLAEELGVFRRYLARGCPAGTPMRLVFLLNVLLLALWSALLLAAVLHAPAAGPLLVGAAAATLAWHATYRGWYRVRCSPGRPGAGLFLAGP